MRFFLRDVQVVRSMLALVITSCVGALLLSAACGGGSGTTLVSIKVTPETATVAVGGTQEFTATGTFSDGTTQDLEDRVTWHFSDDTVAQVSSKMVATALSSSTVTISATDTETGISSTDSDGDAELTVTALSGEVQKLYATNGANWNDYVLNDGSDAFHATGTACDAATAGPGADACLHGGEMHVVEVTGAASCDQLSAADALGAFEWVCDASITPVRMISTGLKDGMGLSDLIDFDTLSFRENSVTVSYATHPYLVTNASVWWENPIVEDNDGSNGSDMTAGEIRVITEATTAQYVVGASQVALLIKPGVTLQGEGVDSFVVYAGAYDYLWLEGEIDSTGDTVALHINGVRFSMLRNIDIVRGKNIGMYLAALSKSRASHLTASHLEGGIFLLDSSENDLQDLIIFDNASEGLRVEGSSLNRFSRVRSSNPIGMGIILQGSYDNILKDVLSSNNGAGYGLLISNSYDNIFSNLTFFNNSEYGFFLMAASDGNIVTDLLIANSPQGGVRVDDSNLNTFIDLSAVNNGGAGIGLSDATNNQFLNAASANNLLTGASLNAGSTDNVLTGLLKVGSNGLSDCAGGAGRGLNADCTPEGGSDFQLTTGITLGDSFIAKTTGDAVNADDVDGVAPFDDITDWIGFENPYRGWGMDGDPFPAVTNRFPCKSGDTCRIWDFSLAAGDAILRDAIAAMPTGDEVLTHTWSDASTVTFLRNAREIIDDGVGNDDGLCESNEDCLFTPNIASYQGHGSLVELGPITDGVIVGVTLYAYEQNGR